MTAKRFFGRMIAIILLVTTSQSLGIEFLVYHVTNPTRENFLRMLAIPLPLEIAVTVLYIALASLLARPVLRFLRAREAGRPLPVAVVQRVQDRCLDLPYLFSLLAFVFFLVCVPLISWQSLAALAWPLHILVYVFMSAVIAGLLAAPIYIFMVGRLTGPVLEMTQAAAPELPPTRRGGRAVSLRLKFVLSVLTLVAGIASYTAIVGYSQTADVLANQAQMEKLLPPEARARLLDRAEHGFVPGVRSSAYYQNRLGGLKAFYLVLLSVAFGAAALLSLAAAQAFTRPLRSLFLAARRVQQGDYATPVRLLANDELAELGGALNEMMATIIGQVRVMERVVENLEEGVRSINETVWTVHAIGRDQTEGTTQQAGAMQEASAVAEEIVAAARQIAGRAKSVDEIAGQTLEACRNGETKLELVRQGFGAVAEEVGRIQGAMRSLEHRFQEIYKMVALMDDLAGQTELLALNASLEAAGAGEAGRRFRVVADSTKRLAVRAAAATREIRKMVETVQQATADSRRRSEAGMERVEQGGRLVESAGSALRGIFRLAEATSAAMGEISTATDQQTTGSEQLAGSVAQVSEVSKRVAAGAKEIHAALDELQKFTDELRRSTGRSAAVRPGEKPCVG